MIRVEILPRCTKFGKDCDVFEVGAELDFETLWELKDLSAKKGFRFLADRKTRPYAPIYPMLPLFYLELTEFDYLRFLRHAKPFEATIQIRTQEIK